MKAFKHLTAGFILFSFLFLAGCEQNIENEVSPTVTEKSNNLTAASQEKVDKLLASLPAGYENRIKQSNSLLLKTHPEYRNLVLKALGAIEPDPTCNDDTPVSLWLGGQLTDWTGPAITIVLATGMLDFPTYDALLFTNSPAGQYYGLNGEYTQTTLKSFKDLNRFWNINSDGMITGAMHGNMLLDREKIIRTDMAVYGDTRAQAEEWADLILLAMELFPEYRRGDHPIFTFNAFALSSFAYPPVGVIPNKIIMGDGIQDAYKALGYGDIATKAIFAHEYGHHIQFQLDLFEDVNSPEATRRTELMADAYAAYYLSHAGGAAMQWKRVQQFLEVFFNIGDCSFTNNGHHGTPLQRTAAANWGYNLASGAQKQGHIMTSQEFAALFDAQLPVLVQN